MQLCLIHCKFTVIIFKNYIEGCEFQLQGISGKMEHVAKCS